MLTYIVTSLGIPRGAFAPKNHYKDNANYIDDNDINVDDNNDNDYRENNYEKYENCPEVGYCALTLNGWETDWEK